MSSGQDPETTQDKDQPPTKTKHKYPHKVSLGKIFSNSKNRHHKHNTDSSDGPGTTGDTVTLHGKTNQNGDTERSEAEDTVPEDPIVPESPERPKAKQRLSSYQHKPKSPYHDEHSVIEQVWHWLEAEKEKKRRRKRSKEEQDVLDELDNIDSLDRLEEILAVIPRPAMSRRPSYAGLARHPSLRSLKNLNFSQISLHGHMSEAFMTEDERTVLQDVPSCDVVLDNSNESSLTFKTEVLKLTHTLKIKHWRKVDLDRGAEIKIARISGALTNAVYKVFPPPERHDVSEIDGVQFEEAKKKHRKPRSLLLRIYGPQVGHLIDRNVELDILRRLAKKNVGPTLLGTFDNGRFEEFLDARTLTCTDIRNPEMSRSIGRRLRDLHDHIPLLASEREEGPGLWIHWYKWVKRAEVVMVIMEKKQATKRPLVTNWQKFREVYETRYKPWLLKEYGGEERIKEMIIFAHNDAQYGNIMQVNQASVSTEPPTPKFSAMESSSIASARSPNLKPRNYSPFTTPKASPAMTGSTGNRLVVIDFEYAGANARGAEFANHFGEWMSDYTGIISPECHMIYAHLYPTIAEQRNCLRAYVEHRPLPYQIPDEKEPSSPSSTRPRLQPGASTFNLDKRLSDEEERVISTEVERLHAETRAWRPAVAACWVLWGIVQANVPGMEVDEAGEVLPAPDTVEETKEEAFAEHAGVKDGELEESGAFDNLKFSEQKAMMFWGDMLQLGLVKEAELKEWAGVDDGMEWDVEKRVKFLKD